MSRKKIVIVGPAYPYRGGNPTFVTYVHDILSTQFDVKIYNYKLLYPSFLFPGTTQFDKSQKVFKKAPSQRVVNSINPLNWIKVATMIKKENADLVIFDWWHPFFAPCHFAISRLIKNFYKNRILFITENYISHEGHFIDRTLTQIGLANADSFIALSSEVETELQQLKRPRRVYRSELPIYPFYSDLSNTNDKTSLGFNPDDFVLLFFGYVRKYKGLDILINAMPQILNSVHNAKLLIVGEFYDDPAIYTNIIKKLNIQDKVKLVNQYVPNEDIEKYYKASDLVVLPYRSATQSGILNIAYGFYKPVLATSVGGFVEYIKDGHTGVIVQPDSPDQIYKGIMKYIELLKLVDFPSNIKAHISKNKFNELPQLIEQIINESSQN